MVSFFLAEGRNAILTYSYFEKRLMFVVLMFSLFVLNYSFELIFYNICIYGILRCLYVCMHVVLVSSDACLGQE